MKNSVNLLYSFVIWLDQSASKNKLIIWIWEDDYIIPTKFYYALIFFLIFDSFQCVILLLICNFVYTFIYSHW